MNMKIKALYERFNGLDFNIVKAILERKEFAEILNPWFNEYTGWAHYVPAGFNGKFIGFLWKPGKHANYYSSFGFTASVWNEESLAEYEF